MSSLVACELLEVCPSCWGATASTAFRVNHTDDLWEVFMTQLMPSFWFNVDGALRRLVYSEILD